MFIMSKFTIKATNADPRAVIEEFLDALETMNLERFLNVWHENGVQIMPLSPEGSPGRIEGKEAIRHHYSSLPAKYELMGFLDRVFYYTDDPNRVWVEFSGEIQANATGKSYHNTFACLFTLCDGQIIEYKEYSNPIVLLNTFANPKKDRAKIGSSPSKK
jgi:ketosteroid isomerase-like protein